MTITYWRLAKYINMKYKWLLLLPVYRYAYIGMIANAYSLEQKLGGVNYSVYDVITSTILYAALTYFYVSNSVTARITTCVVLVVWVLVKVLENFTVLRLFTKKVWLWAVLGLIPGVMLIKTWNIFK